MKRKLVFFVLCFFAGGGFYLLNGASLLILLSCLTVPAALFFSHEDFEKKTILVLVLLFFFWGVIVFAVDNSSRGCVDNFCGRWVKATGTVDSILAQDKFVLKINKMYYREVEAGCKGKFLVLMKGERDIATGQKVEVTGIVRRSTNNGYRNYYRGLGAGAILQTYPQYLKVVQGNWNSIKYYSFKAARWTRSTIEGNFTPEESEVIKGLLLGSKEVSSDTKEKFSGAGISHLLAVSGLHVGILTIVLVWITRKTGFSPGTRFSVICLLLVFFSFMVGLTPSVIRACIMASVVLLSAVVNRQQDALTSLFFTAFLLVAFKPYIVYSISFQLSFLACLGLILCYPVFYRWFQFAGGYLSRSISLTLSSQILLLPLLVHYFGYITPLSLLTNLLVIPLAAVLLWCTVIFLILGAMKIPLYILIAQVSGIIIKAINYIIEITEKIPWGNIQVNESGAGFYLLYYLMICIALLIVHYKSFKEDGVVN